MKKLSPEILNLEQEIMEIQKGNESLYTDLLNTNKIKDVDFINETLTSAMVLIESFNQKKELKAVGIFKSLLNKIPYMSKVEEKVKESVVENMKLSEAVDKLSSSIRTAIEMVNDDLESLVAIYESIENSIVQGKEKLELVEKAIEEAKKDNRKLDLITLDNLKLQLESFNYSNEETLNALDLQLRASQVSAQKLNTVEPIIKNTMLQQLSVAQINSKNERVRRTFDLVHDVLNETIKENKVRSHQAILETMKLAEKQLVSEDTIKVLNSENDKFQIEFRKTVQNLKDERKRYASTLKDAQLKLDSKVEEAILLEENNLKQ